MSGMSPAGNLSSRGRPNQKYVLLLSFRSVCAEVQQIMQSSNGSRIIQELRHRSTTEASAGSEAAKRILFCTSVVAEAPGIALASVFTGAPFITGAPVAAYVF